MSRTNRIALFAALALLVAVSGTVLATRAPQAQAERAPAADEPEGESPPAAEELARVQERLEASEIPVEDGQLAELAGRYGLGGAVRILAWAAESGWSVDELAAMRDGAGDVPGMGWGRIARKLGVHSGIGSIMGNGRADPPGQERQPDE